MEREKQGYLNIIRNIQHRAKERVRVCVGEKEEAGRESKTQDP